MDEIQSACSGELHPQAVEGIKLYNAGRYWHAHEALEEAWLDELGPVRDLYRGILQAGVVYLHAQRKNYRGVVKVYQRCQRWLAPFPDICRGIHVSQLKEDLAAVVGEVQRLGTEGLDHFDESLLKPIQMTTESLRYPPDNQA